MNAVLIDTNVYSEFRRGDAGVLAVFQRAPIIYVSPVVLGELLAGFSFGTRPIANREELARFLATQRVHVLTVGVETAEHYSAIYTGLRRAGTPIPVNDMWIAASALEHRIPLFSFDSHFRRIAGLTVGTNLADFESPL